MNGVICYLLVSGWTKAEHLDILRRVLKKFREHGIRAKKIKCSFIKFRIQYLCHIIDTNGLHPVDSKLKSIVNAPTPRNVAELRSFLGLLNYYG